MTNLWEHFRDDVFNTNDPRTEGWFLVSRPGSLAAILLLYLYFCIWGGPKYMANKPPYSLRTALVVYNFIQVLLSAYVVYEGLTISWLFQYSWICQPADFSDSSSAIRMASIVHFYFVCKIIELLDTVFFVLRKKDRQITFLHLYHHATMPVATWMAVRYYPGGNPSLLGLFNSFVHVVMYGYYMLAALGLDEKKYLWWKKDLTALQIVQFVIVGVHNMQALITGCNVPKYWTIPIFIQCSVFSYMFGSFYVKSYKTNKSNKSHSTLKSH